MQFKSSLSVLLLLFVTKAYSADLQCYVCQNCAKITADTPLEVCDEHLFMGTTEPSTMTTTPMTPTMPSSTHSTTMESSDSTTGSSTTMSSSTTEMSTETTEHSTTEAPAPTPPTPPTARPPMTTTEMPTPPNPDTVSVVVESMNATTSTTGAPTLPTVPTVPTQMPIHNSTTVATTILHPLNSTNSVTPMQVRQRRHAGHDHSSDYTYHCYSVQTKVNNTMVMERGCSRVTAAQAVCDELKSSNNGTMQSNCKTCEKSKCNSSSTLGISMLAVFVGVLGALLHRKF